MSDQELAEALQQAEARVQQYTAERDRDELAFWRARLRALGETAERRLRLRRVERAQVPRRARAGSADEF